MIGLLMNTRNQKNRPTLDNAYRQDLVTFSLARFYPILKQNACALAVNSH